MNSCGAKHVFWRAAPFLTVLWLMARLVVQKCLLILLGKHYSLSQ